MNKHNRVEIRIILECINEHLKNEKWQCRLPSSYNHERREGLVMQYHTILFSTLILHQEVCIIETPDSLFFANKLWWKSHSMILLVLMNFSFTEWERIWVCKIQRRYLSYPISYCCVCNGVCLYLCMCALLL